MRVLLLATGYRQEMEPLVQHRPTPVMSIVDKPLIVHIIEFLVRHKFDKVDIILSHLPHLIENLLEEGLRWGIHITYYLAKDYLYPFNAIRPAAQGWENELVLFGSGDLLPLFQQSTIEKIKENNTLTCMFPSKAWAGWGVFPANFFGSLPPDTTEESLLARLIPPYRSEKVSPFISARSLREYKNSNFRCLRYSSKMTLMPTSAHEVEPGIWLAHGVSIRPGIKITPPIFIGENSQIKENVVLGPQTIIENNCIIDKQSLIQNSIITKNSYVGESLVIKNSIINKNLLINLDHETSIAVHDDFILSELSRPSIFAYPLGLLERLLGVFLLLILSPFYALMSISCKIQKEPMLRLPSDEDSTIWETFAWLSFRPKNERSLNRLEIFFRRLPALLNLIKGDVHFVGVSPRGIPDVKALPLDWRKLYLKSKIGLITLAGLEGEEDPLSDTTYASEVFYSVNMGLKMDFFLFSQWLKNKLFPRSH